MIWRYKGVINWHEGVYIFSWRRAVAGLIWDLENWWERVRGTSVMMAVDMMLDMNILLIRRFGCKWSAECRDLETGIFIQLSLNFGNLGIWQAVPVSCLVQYPTGNRPYGWDCKNSNSVDTKGINIFKWDKVEQCLKLKNTEAESLDGEERFKCSLWLQWEQYRGCFC
jgi:hypothetical protein